MKTHPRLLASYRFSTEELEKMNWLKSTFEKNGYAFDPNRFPEVYYADFEEVQDLFPEKQREEVGDPDALGYYFDFFKQVPASKEEEFLTKSEEGKIILFKDRIEAFCARNRSLSEEDVRFVVLMHELGHWMSHWAQFAGKRWIYGFHFSNRFTLEALAQLIAYWCSKGNPAQEQVLLALSPKDAQGKVDATKVYGAYETLKSHSPGDILKKLAQLRVFWMIKDQKMVEFLGSDSVDMAQWIKEKGKTGGNSFQHEFVEEWMLQFLWDQLKLASNDKKSLKIGHEIFRVLEIGDPQWVSIGARETSLDLNELGF